MRLANVLIMLVLILASSISADSIAAGRERPLPADQAFVFTATVKDHQHIVAEWQMAPGYYLYAKKFHFKLEPNAMADIQMPSAEVKYQPNKTPYEIYTNHLQIPVALPTQQQQWQLSVEYQGCSQHGFCYPPMHKEVILHMANAAPTPANSSLHSLLSDQAGIQSVMQNQHLGVTLLIFAALGLLLAFTPCVLPMIPILTSIIVGQRNVVSSKKAFFLSTAYVLGTAVAYAAAGLLVASMGSSLQLWLQKPWIIAAVAGLFVLLAFSLFGYYELRVPSAWQNRITQLSNSRRGGSYLSIFLMGSLSTLIVSPCVTAPLVGVLMYIAETGNLLLGASALFAMGIGMGMPLLLIGMSAGKWLPKSGPWMEAIKKTFGILMLAMAVWLTSRIMPSQATIALWGVLLILVAAFIGLHLPNLIGLHKVNRGVGFFVGVSGMIVMFSGVGMPSFVNNWVNGHHAEMAADNFTVVHTIEDLNKRLALAQAAHQPVMLDFYAEWCESCVAMDKHVFNAPSVKPSLANYVLLRADLTENTDSDQALLKNYAVIAPPTVLFFDGKGREIHSQRIVGEVNAKEFITRLTQVWDKVASSK